MAVSFLSVWRNAQTNYSARASPRDAPNQRIWGPSESIGAAAKHSKESGHLPDSDKPDSGSRRLYRFHRARRRLNQSPLSNRFGAENRSGFRRELFGRLLFRRDEHKRTQFPRAPIYRRASWRDSSHIWRSLRGTSASRHTPLPGCERQIGN